MARDSKFILEAAIDYLETNGTYAAVSRKKK
jgi:hypothetical protein